MSVAAESRTPLASWLRLLRVGTLFSPAADVVAGACLIGLPWSFELVRAMVASVLVYAAGMVLNDHADRAEDAVQRPERPLPRGEIAPRAAVGAGVALLALALAIAPWRAYWAVLAMLVLAYDYVFKRRVEFAAPAMGLLRALNLVAGAAFAATAIPDAQVVLIPAGAYWLYVASVTVLGHYEDVPRVAPRAVVGVQTVPPLAAALALLVLPETFPAFAIGAVLAGFFLARRTRADTVWDRATIRTSMTWLLLGTMVYTSLLCLGSGRIAEALGVAAAILPARMISRRIALT